MSSELLNASGIVERHLDQPDKLAFVAADSTLTYGALHRQVCRAGHLLRELAENVHEAHA